MKAIKDEFPNPVLAAGRDDYIDSCSFRTVFDENEIIVDLGAYTGDTIIDYLNTYTDYKKIYCYEIKDERLCRYSVLIYGGLYCARF